MLVIILGPFRYLRTDRSELLQFLEALGKVLIKFLTVFGVNINLE